jgi:hypothetical protein
LLAIVRPTGLPPPPGRLYDLVTMGDFRATAAAVVVAALGSVAHAGTVTGKLDLPAPPERQPPAHLGFVERTENPLTPPRPLSLAPYVLVVLDGDAKPAAPPAVTWDLAGNSFARPVIGALVNADITIKNSSRVSRTMIAAEDPKVVPPGPLNPTGQKSFKVGAPVELTVADKDAPYLRGKLVVVAASAVANLDDANHFVFDDVAPGEYKLRAYFFNPAGASGWLDVNAPVTVSAKGKVEVNPKVTSLAPAAPGK